MASLQGVARQVTLPDGVLHELIDGLASTIESPIKEQEEPQKQNMCEIQSCSPFSAWKCYVGDLKFFRTGAEQQIIQYFEKELFLLKRRVDT